MRIRYRRLLAATLGLALTGSLAGSAWAVQDDQETGEAKKTRRIVRVISTSDGSPNHEVGNQGRVVIVGEGGISAPRILSGFSHWRGYLGIRIVELTPELRSHFGAPEDAGVMISTVVEGSPAADSGLKVADILTAIDGQNVTSGFEVASKISAHDDQTVATLEIWREGTIRTLSATIVERERPAIDIGRVALPDAGQLHERIWLGTDTIPEHIIEIDQGGLQDALHELELRFDNPDFVEKFKLLGQNRLDLQKRIEELEKRLKDLEQQLDKLPRE